MAQTPPTAATNTAPPPTGAGETPAGLTHYPVLSVELLNLDELATKLKQPSAVERVTHDILSRLENQLKQQQAHVESVRDNVLFCSFRTGQSVGAVLSHALKVAVAASRKTIALDGVTLHLRIGLDIVPAAELNPMAGVPERLAAEAGQVLVSQTVYRITSKHLPYETVGPIKVHGQLRTMFRVALPQAQPAPTAPEPATPQPAQQTPPEQASKPGEAQQPPQPQSRPDAPPPEPALIERKLVPMEALQDIHWNPPQFYTAVTTEKHGTVAYQQALEAIEGQIHTMLAPRSANSEEKPGRMIGLCGPAGSGKSTIISLARAKFEPETLFWMGANCFESYYADVNGRQAAPLTFWTELLYNLLGFPLERIPQQAGEDHLDGVLGAMFGQASPEAGGGCPPATRDFFRTVLSLRTATPSLPSLRQYAGQLIGQIYDLLAGMAQVRPIVLVMENLDTADPASIDLLLHLLQRDLLSHPITLIFTYPLQWMPVGPLQQAFGMLPFAEYALTQADEGTLIALAEPPLSVPWKKLPDWLRGRLVVQASPLYLEEAFRWLQQEGGFAIHPKTGKFTPEKKLKNMDLPDDVESLIQGRLAGQDQTCRYVLQVASALGERFSTNMLSDLTQLGKNFDDILKYLWQNGFIMPDNAGMARFRHHQIWQAAYASLDVDARRQAHQLIADYCAEGLEAGLAYNPLDLAMHRMRGLDPASALDTWAQTAIWLGQLGSAMGATMALMRMQALADLLEVTLAGDQQRQLLETMGVLNMDMQPELAKLCFLGVLHQQGTTAPAPEWLEAALLLAQTYERLGAFPHATATLRRAITQFGPRLSAPEVMAIAAREMASLYNQGNYLEALQIYRQDIVPVLGDFAESVEIPSSIRENASWRFSALLAGVTWARIAVGRLAGAQAIRVTEALLPHCEAAQETQLGMQARLVRCLGMLTQGQLSEAQAELDAVFRQIEQVPQAPAVLAEWGYLVVLANMQRGDWAQAGQMLPNVSYQAEQGRDFLQWAHLQATAGWLALQTGQAQQAHMTLENAVTMAAEYHLAHPALEGWRFMAQYEMAQNNLDVAEQLCQRAIEVAEKPNIGNAAELAQLNLTLAQVWTRKKAYQKAGQLLEKQCPQLVKAGALPLVAQAAMQIAHLYTQMCAHLPPDRQERYIKLKTDFAEKARHIWQQQNNTYQLAQLDQSLKA